MSLVTDLRSNINEILKIRDELGAVKASVSIVTRTWSGEGVGYGEYSDFEIEISPSPRIIEYSDDYRVREGGALQMGDLKITGISRQSFLERDEIDCSVCEPNIERFYKVGNAHYRVLTVEEKYLTWGVILRRISG